MKLTLRGSSGTNKAPGEWFEPRLVVEQIQLGELETSVERVQLVHLGPELTAEQLADADAGKASFFKVRPLTPAVETKIAAEMGLRKRAGDASNGASHVLGFEMDLSQALELAVRVGAWSLSQTCGVGVVPDTEEAARLWGLERSDSEALLPSSAIADATDTAHGAKMLLLGRDDGGLAKAIANAGRALAALLAADRDKRLGKSQGT